jgi:hypothetical protein
VVVFRSCGSSLGSERLFILNALVDPPLPHLLCHTVEPVEGGFIYELILGVALEAV